MSTGFIVILFAATILVILPSANLTMIAWREGGAARVAAVLAILFFAVNAMTLFDPYEWPYSMEAGLVVLLGVWTCFFVLVVLTLLVACVIRKAIRWFHESHQRTDAPLKTPPP